jgi:integrase
VRPIIGKREFIKSLGTSDRREAEALALSIVSVWKAEVDACAMAPANDTGEAAVPINRCPTMAEIEEAALLVGFEEASRKLEGLIESKAKLGSGAFEAMRAAFAKRYTDACRKQLAGENGFWLDKARAMARRRGWSITEDSAEFSALVTSLAKCGTDLFRKAVATVEDPGMEFVPSSHTQGLYTRRKERAKQGEGLLDLYDLYAAQRLSEGKKRTDTLQQDRKAVEGFADFVGRDRSLRSITPEEVRGWRNATAALPACYKKHKVYAGMSMKEAADYAVKTNAKRVSLVTVNKNLSAVSSLFIWAKREGYADANPCDGLRYDVDKRKNPRPPFNTAQLNEILASPLFTGFKCDGKEHLPGDQHSRDWRFWIPLVCLFTGARIGEIAQLHVGDIDRQDDHWFIHIRNDEGKGQQTKSGHSRPAPIHSQLEKIGFIEFVQQQQRKAAVTGDEKLFPELSVNERGQNGYASRFWRTYLKRIEIKKGADGLGAHSFRHGLADQLRLAGYFDRDIEVVLGHNQASVTSGYGKLRQGTVARLSAMIEDAKFEGVNFSHLALQGMEGR